ncbi:hypothetical protein NPX13_g8926 [Xylaria arbuscula]|uniref:LysM domain-containing protein n=1 Tax=Xylaria arbuscula TaxID=114810 RepID=A0A9W8N7Z9_9PEZI|nr:hypothetical protein NPX13_g8926 [Xylaria arbuscula]
MLTAAFAASTIQSAAAQDTDETLGPPDTLDAVDKRWGYLSLWPQPPNGPVQDGAPIDRCAVWHSAQPGDTCYIIENKVGLEHGMLRALNPQLHGDCDHNLWAGYWYCWALSKNRGHDPGFSAVPPPPPQKKPHHECKAILHDKCASAVFAAKETPAPMRNWCKRYLDGPTCTETRPEGIFSSYDGFPKRAMASSLCAYPSAPPMAPRFSTACQCFTQMHPQPTA